MYSLYRKITINGHFPMYSKHFCLGIQQPLYNTFTGIQGKVTSCVVSKLKWGCLGVAVSGILRHQGVQLILAVSWARPAILVAGKGRGESFHFFLVPHFHSCSSFFSVPLFHLLYYLFYLFSPFRWETAQNDPQGLTCC